MDAFASLPPRRPRAVRFVSANLRAALLLATVAATLGCNRGHQYARVIKPGERQMIGSHRAGQETFGPLVEDSVGKLLAKVEQSSVQLAADTGQPPGRMSICFVGVENASSEEIGDAKEQIYEAIDQKVRESSAFQLISRRYVDAGIKEVRLQPAQLFVPDNMRMFCGVMEQAGQPFDYLMVAKLTSLTTQENKEYQRDYQLTLELVNVNTGIGEKQYATLSKGYHTSRTSRWGASVWPFNR